MTALNPGTIYEFKVQARNQYGLSEYSDTITLLCAFIPTIPTGVQTTLISEEVKVEWNLASDNGSPITSYSIYIKVHNSEIYELESTDCIGTNVNVISNMYCYIDITTLLGSPFNIDGGDSIWAKVVATNVYGDTV